MIRTILRSMAAATALAACVPAMAGGAIDVPGGSAILLDGRCDPDEWAGAREQPLADGAMLRLKQGPDDLYLCVQPRQPTWFGVDLYIARPGEKPFNLHASAKLGERVWLTDRWSDFKWWDQAGWVANTSRGVVFEKREFLPDHAKEFQVRRSRVGSKPFQLMVEIHGEQSVASPAQARADQPAGWFTISVGQV
jgi:hypothetical protein